MSNVSIALAAGSKSPPSDLMSPEYIFKPFIIALNASPIGLPFILKIAASCAFSSIQLCKLIARL